MSRRREAGDKPREMVYRAMADAKEQLHRAGRVWTGAIGAEQPQRAREKIRRELHAAAMAYLDQIRRFEGKSDVQEQWNEDIESTGKSLCGLADNRFSTVTVQEQQYNTQTNRTEYVSQKRPWLLTIPEADAMINQLDSCALALGFDDNPGDGDRGNVAYSEVGGDATQTENEHSPQPVEVGGNGD